jgi:glyoxylase-like metal-dependent hydrolase (beta-lactamase superfamily II)
MNATITQIRNKGSREEGSQQVLQPQEKSERTPVYCLDLGITRCYLLTCTGGYLLIDTSYPQTYPRFLKALDKIGVDLCHIRYLLLTHHHDDHAGFAAKLVEQTGCTIIAHQQAVLPLRRGASEETMEPVNRRVALLFSLFKLFHRSFTFPPVVLSQKDRLLKGDDFDVLGSIGIDGIILSTPGHSKDSISVLLSDGRAFVGDVSMNFSIFNLCGIRYRPIYQEEKDTVFESWVKLVASGARIIYPAHTTPFSVEKWQRCWPQYFREGRSTVK